MRPRRAGAGRLFFGTGSGDRSAIINSTVGLAKAARAFDVPVVLSTVAAESFSGPLMPQLAGVFPDQKTVDRTTMNAWEDVHFVEAVRATGRRKLVIAGLWTEVCVVLPAASRPWFWALSADCSPGWCCTAPGAGGNASVCASC